MHIFLAIFNYVAMHIFVTKTKSKVGISQHIDTGMNETIVSPKLFSFNHKFNRITWVIVR